MTPLLMLFALGFLLALLPALVTYGLGNARAAFRSTADSLSEHTPNTAAGKPDTAVHDPRVWAHTGHLRAALGAVHDQAHSPLITTTGGHRRTR